MRDIRQMHQPLRLAINANHDEWKAPTMFPSPSKMLPHAMQGLGPYLLVELLLPGGTLIALSLWLYRLVRSASNSSWGLGQGDWGFETKDVELGLAAGE